MQQKYIIQILIIDDKLSDARAYRSKLARALRTRANRRSSGPLFNFEIEVMAATSNESMRAFLDRVSEYVEARQLRKNIHIVLIDYLFEDDPCGIHFGEETAAIFRRLSPTTARFLFTHFDPARVPHTEPFHHVMQKAQLEQPTSASSAANEILEALKVRFETRLWDGLRKYADMDKIVMHAMAMADGKSVYQNPLVSDLIDFFGENLLRSEASLTQEPLDSLLSPSGCIRFAQMAFARTFGAHSAWFCTNGTSTANKIVSEAHLGPGDLVFLDRNCHISHHYAYMLGSYRPLFLNPQIDEVHGLPLAITPEIIANQTRAYLEECERLSQPPTFPKLIVVTNCSFDGHLVRPNEIIEAYLSVLEERGFADFFEETAFLFDEAWFGFGRFHPQLIEFTASGADYSKLKASGRDVRVYATTSVHKTMSSMRQASVILVMDEKAKKGSKRAEIEMRFRQAFNCHTTTSPNMPILASMDLARRQMELDGFELIQGAIQCARTFRVRVSRWKEEGHVAAKFFSLIEEGRYTLFGCDVDPTKLTMLTASSISGLELKKRLWQAEDHVQVNKFGPHSVLLMFMIGSTPSLVEKLARAFEHVAETLETEGYMGESFIEDTPIISDVAGLSEFMDKDGTIQLYPAGVAARRVIGAREAIFSHEAGFYAEIDPTDNDEFIRLQSLGTVIAACFITPYPPGFPIIIPGEVITLESLQKIQTYLGFEVHGLVKRKGIGEKNIMCLSVRVLLE